VKRKQEKSPLKSLLNIAPQRMVRKHEYLLLFSVYITRYNFQHG
jgi:hypothetical protein